MTTEKHAQEKNPKQQNKEESSAHAQPDSKEKAVKDDSFFVPILRTYDGDQEKFSHDVSESELRTILAREAAHQKIKKEGHQQQARDLIKESFILKETKNSLQKKWKDGEKKGVVDTEKKIRSQKENLNASVKRATAHLIPKEGNGIIQTSAPVTPLDEPVQKAERKSDGNQKTEEKGQEKIVEKAATQKKWKDLQKKKEVLREQDLASQDLRSFNVQETKGLSFQRQDLVSLIIVIFTLIALIISVFFIATYQPSSTQISTPLIEKRSS